MSLAFLEPETAPEPRRRSETASISYATAATTAPRRVLIRSVEAVTGRHAVLRRVAGYEADVAAGRDLWRVMMERFGLRLDVIRGSLGAIPSRGPLVVVSNHPFGILDGLVLGHLLSAVRGGDFRIMAHQIFDQAEPLRRIILPVDFSGTRAAQAANIATRAEAIRYLKAGGAVGIFPGGTVATGATPMAPARDPLWRGFTAKMVAKSGATVIPLWFEGENSRLFQMVSHVSSTLRMGLLVHEFARRLDRPVPLAVGEAIPPAAIDGLADAKEVMDFLRRKTYELSPNPSDWARLGLEFEEHYRR